MGVPIGNQTSSLHPYVIKAHSSRFVASRLARSCLKADRAHQPVKLHAKN
jgi:hypothetical protein